MEPDHIFMLGVLFGAAIVMGTQSFTQWLHRKYGGGS